jgi:hypothetical protein
MVAAEQNPYTKCKQLARVSSQDAFSMTGVGGCDNSNNLLMQVLRF